MKKGHILMIILALAVSPEFGCDEVTAPTSKLDWVDPFIGTGGHGHTFPGATVPYGMVQLSPDTRLNGWDACSGYHISDDVILGFSHTHLSGTGIGDYGDILLMPVTGEPKIPQGTADAPEQGYCSRKAPGTEKAKPGYYTVALQDYGISVDLTTTTRAGLHRYHYPKGKKPGVIVDIGHTLQSHQNKINRIEVVNDRELRGYKVTRGWARDHRVYFHAIFSQPFTWKFADKDKLLTSTGRTIDQVGAKAILSFDKLKDEELLVKVGISGVDYEGARKNVVTEIPGWNFEAVRQNAESQWNEWLSKIDIKGGTDDQKKIFYTALYHTGISPNLYTDVDGRYLGMDKKIHQASGYLNYSVFSLWDTFRAFHPLMTIINGEKNSAWINSLLQKYKEGGVLPMWELSSNETGTMIGYNAVPVIVDAYRKGDRSFDVELAYQAIKHSSTYDTTSIVFPDNEVKNNLMPKAKYFNEALGFIPCDKENESVSKALEYAYDDWCIAMMASSLGKSADYENFLERSTRYRKYFDKSTGFMRGRNVDGSWKTPFNPKFSNHRRDEYVEGNAWQWSWFVPHDIDGLIALHGGKELFTKKLDSLFSVSSEITGENSSADISGLIGQYAHGNEPSHHIAYLYNYVDQPHKTQELVDRILNDLYFNDPNGLSGNEDCGQMSAWFVLSSMGIYQVSPGTPVYALGRPLFNEATINLENGKQFLIRAHNNTRSNKYVSTVKLNGKTLDKMFINHQDIVNGGVLEFEMTASPTAK